MNSLQKAKQRAKNETGKGKKSKLDEHIKAIQFLRFDENWTISQIQNFLLEDCKCNVSISTLHGFIKRRFKQNNNEINSNNIELEKVKNTKVSTPKKIEKKDIKTTEKNKNNSNGFEGKSAMEILNSNINVHDFLNED